MVRDRAKGSLPSETAEAAALLWKPTHSSLKRSVSRKERPSTWDSRMLSDKLLSVYKRTNHSNSALTVTLHSEGAEERFSWFTHGLFGQA